MGDRSSYTLSGPKWWADMVNELFLRLQREVAEDKLKLPLMVTDDATDGQLLYVAMDENGNFDAKSYGLTQNMFPLPATVTDSGGHHPLTIKNP